MYFFIKALLVAATAFPHIAVHATELSHKEYERFTNSRFKGERKELHGRAKGNIYLNIAKGIFNSKGGNIIQNAADIPCDVIDTLQSDADQAEQFVSQIQAGQVPSIITDLPEEAVSQFADIIDVATMVYNVAEAAVTDVVGIFNDIEDGSITSHFVSDIEAIPTELVDAITNGWNDFTSEIEDVWGDVTCFFGGDCPSTTSAGFCAVPASASASATLTPTVAASSNQNPYPAQTTTPLPSETAPVAPTATEAQNTATQPVATAQPTPSVYPANSKGTMSYAWGEFNGLVVAALTIFGIALWL